MEMQPEPRDPETQMRCTGCGGKIGGSVLGRVLKRLDVPQSENVLIGLDNPDDAAVVQIAGGRPVTATVDFFSAPLDDPYIVGRLAALNAASDAFAIGAKPVASLAIATIPFGSPRRQEQVLYETLAGSLEEFRKMDCSLVGGHTIEGPMLTVGFTVLADQGEKNDLLTKGRLREGDLLLLTKPLGSGILLAGHMQALCQGAWMSDLLNTMLLSNQLAMEAVNSLEISAVTDVTGFGFAGHLLEMLRASKMSAKLELAKVPILAGTEYLLNQGIESTLAPANKDVEMFVRASEGDRTQPQYKALFDPQTCGGILMGVAPDDAEQAISRLAEQSNIPASIVGEVISPQGSDSSITLL
jgi:selenide,water dikinase